MIRVGIVGFGFMGRMHYRCWRALEEVEIAAVCDVNPNTIKEADRTAGNTEGTSGGVDLRSVQIYGDFDKMLLEQRLDAVSITVPTYLHAGFSIKALEAGVDVLCEKPMALNVEACERMIEAAKSSGKVLQIGHCVRFWPEYAKAKEIVDGGEYGKVVAATFQRLVSAPNWAADDWFADEKLSGGMALDLHIHDTDFVQYLFGVPRAVRSFGASNSAGQLVHVVTQYLYDDEKTVMAEGSWAMMAVFGFEMSFNILLEKATLVYDCTREPRFRVCPAKGESFAPQVQEGDGYSLEIEHFAKKVKGQEIETVTSLQQARDSVRIVAAEKESVAKGEPVAL
jgi:predicted dehydrogenase